MKLLEFAKKYIDRDISFWKFIFSDENKFNIFGWIYYGIKTIKYGTRFKKFKTNS